MSAVPPGRPGVWVILSLCATSFFFLRQIDDRATATGRHHKVRLVERNAGESLHLLAAATPRCLMLPMIGARVNFSLALTHQNCR